VDDYIIRLNTNALTLDDGSNVLAPEGIQACDAVITLLVNWVPKKDPKDFKAMINAMKGEDKKFEAAKAFYDLTKDFEWIRREGGADCNEWSTYISRCGHTVCVS